MCHTRELAFQISKEYERFSKFLPAVKVGVFFGGLAIAKDEQVLKNNCPHIVVGTPGRILALIRSKKLPLKNLKHFVLDECDKMLEQLDMRRDVQEIFRATPHEKQVMMFSATLSVLVMCHTRELAFQISKEYERFSKFLPAVKVGVFFGGLAIAKDEQVLKNNCPHIVVGTPGRILALIRSKKLPLKNLKHFVLDECDKMLEQLDMRRDVQEIFRATPHEKQVMMFSATLSKDIRPVCKKFMQDPMEVYIDDEAKLTLHGLRQHYVKLKDSEKNRKLFELLDVLEFNQVVIFVKSVQRCVALAQLLIEQNFPAIAIHRGMSQEERLSRYQQFKDFQKRILVATNLFGRGMDIERVNIVFNYDMPEDTDTYLHRVARAGRFGTKGLAITFVSDESDAKTLNEVQERFEVDITELPDEIDLSSYIEGR